MVKIIVQLKSKSYPILIESGLIYDPKAWPLYDSDRVMLVTNTSIASLYLNKLIKSFNLANINVDTIILPDGEQYKSLSILNRIFTLLIKKSYGRDAILIAFGGGVIGDLVGFAAASYQRGIRFIQVPTTLLAQVDAAIGGKTAVNHKLGKNMIGAFHQPISVIVDLNCLHTLSKRQFYSGLAEIIKYGIILDGDFFNWLENNLDLLLTLDLKALMYCVPHCCQLKSNIVSHDEYDQNSRVLLNLGHTYGHAIESYTNYLSWLHGEAISVGMMMAARTSYYLGYLKKEDMDRIQTLLLRAHLPIVGPKDMSPSDYLSYMIHDKKVISNDKKLRLVLPLSIGNADVFSNIENKVILSAIEDSNSVTI
ncbi:3-dehydroquinate synthase [Candidatus Schneideria nysicola]|uniref:3-dehydroquinate synthase n=1 Tax=Candidatus Schneideria nysicola TaxID=1081631 RepID=UPI001CAA71C8|nr:3-dehydroquinate synthase [Candidatus Schneideria nysicola]UAJ66159.1 3-dehydroquinate synthase [Candidatus Schneideria nysicola]